MNPEDIFKGSDMTISVGGKEIGKIQGIDYSTKRDEAVFTLGTPDSRSFSRGKRGIAGSMVVDKLLQEEETMNLGGLTVNERYGAGILNGKGIAKLTPQVDTGFEYHNVLILPIDGLTKADLFEFMPKPEDVFQLERLVKLNPDVFPYNKGKARVTGWNVLDEGIVGSVVLLSVE